MVSLCILNDVVVLGSSKGLGFFTDHVNLQEVSITLQSFTIIFSSYFLFFFPCVLLVESWWDIHTTFARDLGDLFYTTPQQWTVTPRTPVFMDLYYASATPSLLGVTLKQGFRAEASSDNYSLKGNQGHREQFLQRVKKKLAWLRS